MRKIDTTQKNTERKVLSYCLKHTMFQKGDRVVLGVSGGADSICLLFVLLSLREVLGIKLHVVHVNHGLREDAGEDAAYVEDLCREYGILFMLEEIQLTSLAKDLKLGEEEAGRAARYEAFEKACKLYGCNKIAVAHNSNDRAETMLFNLFRGTGMKGVAGIQAVRDNIVRPLLCLERSEIDEYLECRGIAYKQDSTNAEDDYTRNRIRHHIIPYAQKNVTEACVNNMCRAAEIFAEEEAYMEEQTYAAKKACVIMESVEEKAAYENGIHEGKANENSIHGSRTSESCADNNYKRFVISIDKFLELHPVIRKRLLLLLLKHLSPQQKDITAVHIEEILTLFTQPGNRQIHLPYHIRGERSYSQVWLERKPVSKVNSFGWPEQKTVSEVSDWPQEASGKVYAEILIQDYNVGDEHTVTLPNGTKFIVKVQEIQENSVKNGVFSQNRYTKWFDYDKIKGTLQVRTRKTGDYLTIHGSDSMQHKKLKDYMITEKIPKQERDAIPLLAEDNHILWLAGYRISEYFKVTINTRRILQVQFLQCDNNAL